MYSNEERREEEKKNATHRIVFTSKHSNGIRNMVNRATSQYIHKAHDYTLWLLRLVFTSVTKAFNAYTQ